MACMGNVKLRLCKIKFASNAEKEIKNPRLTTAFVNLDFVEKGSATMEAWYAITVFFS